MTFHSMAMASKVQVVVVVGHGVVVLLPYSTKLSRLAGGGTGEALGFWIFPFLPDDDTYFSPAVILYLVLGNTILVKLKLWELDSI